MKFEYKFLFMADKITLVQIHGIFANIEATGSSNLTFCFNNTRIKDLHVGEFRDGWPWPTSQGHRGQLHILISRQYLYSYWSDDHQASCFTTMGVELYSEMGDRDPLFNIMANSKAILMKHIAEFMYFTAIRGRVSWEMHGWLTSHPSIKGHRC